MNRVAILSSHLQPGDAVSNDALGMCSAFEKRGHEARLYAGSSDFPEPKVFNACEVHQFLTEPADLLIYHYSIAWEPGIELLREAKCCTAIKYHNITPPEFFVDVSPWHEEKCRAGLEALKDIARAGCDLYLADSEYNRSDLVLVGFDEEKTFVVPPFHQADCLYEIEADLEMLDAYRDGMKNILMVGRVAPNKGHLELIKAFAIYHHYYNSNSRLLIVGKEEDAFQIYSQRLREMAAFLATEDAVSFIGAVSTNQLKACYLLASVFAIASEHEGFCVPVVEAMSMKVPVVAYASSAIPATVGGAGIVLDEREPSLMAGAFDLLTRDEALNIDLGMMGRRRYEDQFTNEKAKTELFRAVSHLGQPAARAQA